MRFGKPAEEESRPSPVKPLFPLSLAYPIPNLVDETRNTTIKVRLVKWRCGKAAPWGDLPLGLSEDIGTRLVSRLDILRFRSVCKNWRLSLPSPNLFPLRVPPPPESDPFSAYFITELNIHFNPIRDGNSLHLEVEGLDHDCKFRRPMASPLLPKFKCPKGVLFMGDRKHQLSRMPFVGKCYFVRRGFMGSKSVQLGSRYKPVLKMVVVSGSNVISSNAEGVNPSYVRVSDLSVVALVRGGTMNGRLAVLRLGGGGENWNSWNWNTGFCSHVFADIGTYKGKLSAIDNSGRVFLMDYHSLEMTQIAPASDIAPGKDSKLLFEVGGDLYLADFSNKTGVALVFYKLDLQRGVWIRSSNGCFQRVSKCVAMGAAFPYWIENRGPDPDRPWHGLALPPKLRAYLLALVRW